MPQVIPKILATLLVCSALIMTPAKAEVSISLSISGEPSELIAILNLLRQEGYGTETVLDGDDPHKIRVESFSGQEEAIAEVDVEESLPVEVTPPPTPLLVLANPIVTPQSVPASAKILVSLALIDERSAVDTIAITLEGKSYDLSDAGDQGDQIAGDGIWSTEINIPESFKPGTYSLDFTAFDAHGMPVSTTDNTDDPIPLTASTTFEVQN